MLGWRLFLSAVIVPSLLLLFRIDSGLGPQALILLALCLLLTVRSCFEAADLLRVRNLQPSFPTTAACCTAVVLSAWAHTWFSPTGGLLTSLGWIASATTASMLILMAREAWLFESPGRSMESLGANLIIVLYCGLLLAVVAQFRWFPSHKTGYFAIGSMIIAVKSGDTGAYTLGRLFGKRKMAPKLSPGKTWAGGTGAVLGACLGGLLWLSLCGAFFDAQPKLTNLPSAIFFCCVMGVIGLIGDLCESLIKRDVEKKDAAALMPGFGGLLDLLDSVLYAGPVALAWWALWPPAG